MSIRVRPTDDDDDTYVPSTTEVTPVFRRLMIFSSLNKSALVFVGSFAHKFF